MTLLYNLLMAAVDLGALGLVWRKRSVLWWIAAMCCAAVAAIVLAIVLREASWDFFDAARLACYGLFLHGVVLLAASAVLLWRISRLWAAACAVAVVGVLLAAVDAFLVEPFSLEVSRVQIASPKIARPLKIVVLADFQTDRLGPYERGVLRRVVEEKPDLLLLAGDYLQAPLLEYELLAEKLNIFLREIHFAASGRSFAVRGNVDGPDWGELFAGLNITRVSVTQSFELDQLRLTCLGRGDSFNPSLAIPGGRPGRFHLVLGHSPNFALGHIEADLLVAGHTHGGQVRLPWLVAPVTNTQVPHAWAAGLTDLPEGGKLLVSRGVGMERGYAPQLRFCCRPELVVIDLVPAVR